MSFTKFGVEMNIKTLILTGEGINCENETAHAFSSVGSEVELVHVSDFLKLESLDPYDILAFPGGFSYGDEIRSGKILAEKIKLKQQKNIEKFISDKKPIIGICNGFQILAQLGVFNESGPITLAENNHGKFINFWVEMDVKNQNSLWLQNLPNKLFMPVRHKEGRIIGTPNLEQMALAYKLDINGSYQSCAAMTNKAGNVFGLMPHPEAAIHEFLLPHSPEKSQANLQIFKNAVEYVKRIKK